MRHFTSESMCHDSIDSLVHVPWLIAIHLLLSDHTYRCEITSQTTHTEAKCRIYMCDPTYSYAWHATPLYVFNNSFISVLSHTHMRVMRFTHMRNDSFILVLRLIRIRDMFFLYVLNDSFINATRHTHMHVRWLVQIRKDSSICGIRLMSHESCHARMRDSFICFTHVWHLSFMDSSICGIRLICTRDMAHSYVLNDSFISVIRHMNERWHAWVEHMNESRKNLREVPPRSTWYNFFGVTYEWVTSLRTDATHLYRCHSFIRDTWPIGEEILSYVTSIKSGVTHLYRRHAVTRDTSSRGNKTHSWMSHSWMMTLTWHFIHR